MLACVQGLTFSLRVPWQGQGSGMAVTAHRQARGQQGVVVPQDPIRECHLRKPLDIFKHLMNSYKNKNLSGH